MDKHLQENLQWWNEAAQLHAASAFYDLEGFLIGKSTLKKIEKEKLGDLRGKKLLHLQCHFGMDTLSLARLGARVTGVDFSEEAIKLAKSLNEKLGLDAQFVCANVYDLPQHLSGQYDFVYTSYGVLCWLNDLPNWAKVIAHFLKPGGRFLIVESHPLADMLDVRNQKLEMAYSYFFNQTPYTVTDDGSYADRDAEMNNKTTHEWAHSISEIMQSLCSAGLTIQTFEEYPYCFYEKFGGMMEKNEDGWWVFKDESWKGKLPLMFSMTAKKTNN